MRHDFRDWCQTLDWIVQNILKMPPLMDNHKSTQERMSNPKLVWLRNIALAVQQQKRLRSRVESGLVGEFTRIVQEVDDFV